MATPLHPFQNPILPGFHPDPSICRAGDDYFLVNSSFAYFPGVPLFHSRDLVHWRPIGYCLDRPEQLPIGRVGTSAGIFAPSIRFHDGIFYMVTTNISHGGNFYVTTRDPFGPWSDPIWVAQDGIDPSLFFDEGCVYFTSTGMTDDPSQGQGIIQSEIDLATGRLLTKPRLIWRGTGGSYPEGPHLYRIGDRYYLMIAEGGTEYGHTEVIARSDSPWGPWESCPHNPILTHRSYHSPIHGLGHADLVQAQDGTWWSVFLGFRPVFPQAHHLGRETFLAPVNWDDEGWPYIGKAGRIDLQMESPSQLPVTWDTPAERDNFDDTRLDMKWNFLGNPEPGSWSLASEPGSLALHGNSLRLDDGTGVAFVGCRQEHFNCEVATRLRFSPMTDGEEAGLTVWMDARHHCDLFITMDHGKRSICVRRRIGSLSAIVAQEEVTERAMTLIVRANSLFYGFALLREDGSEQLLATAETRYLSTEVAGGFTGVYFAMYASGNGQAGSAPAYFDWFDYRDIDQPGSMSIDSSVAALLKIEEARDVIGRYLPQLLENPPIAWQAVLPFVAFSAMSPEVIPPEKLLLIDTELRSKRIPSQNS
jgi:xylan 1,4-beta-xylosidase